VTALDAFSVANQVVAVTGAGRGIGRAIALDAARSGALVSACSRTDTELESLAEEIENFGGRCEWTTADLGSVAGVQDFVRFTTKAYGRIDAIVNNAGFNRLKDALDYDEDDVDVLLNVNLKSVYFLCTAAAREMIGQGGGAIVNITSQAGVVGAPGRAPYSAAKAGVNNLTRTLAAEWATHQIRVNAVAPTVTLTPLARTVMAERPSFAEEVKEKILLGRPAEVEEISLPVLFLLSRAAAMITGHTLVVDGGWTIT
jgi:gluconate 5-dehydrogenase